LKRKRTKRRDTEFAEKERKGRFFAPVGMTIYFGRCRDGAQHAAPYTRMTVADAAQRVRAARRDDGGASPAPTTALRGTVLKAMAGS